MDKTGQENTGAARGGYRAALADRPFLLLTATNVLFVLCSVSLEVLLSVFVLRALHQPVWLAGVLFAVNTIPSAVGQTPLSAAFAGLRPIRVLQLSGAVWAVSFALFWLASGVPGVAAIASVSLAVVVFTVAEMIQGPVVNDRRARTVHLALQHRCEPAVDRARARLRWLDRVAVRTAFVSTACDAAVVAKTQYLVAASLDGFIADQDNSLEWLFQAEAAARAEATAAKEDRFTQFFRAVGAMAMGATTYEWVLEHEKLLDQPDKWHDYYGDVPSWVFTHRQLPPIPGARISFVSGDVRPVHEQMTAAAAGQNVWIVGGGELAGQFADQGLLAEIIITIAPATLGAGAPLLPRRLGTAELTLTECRQDGPFAYLTYAVTPPPGSGPDPLT